MVEEDSILGEFKVDVATKKFGSSNCDCGCNLMYTSLVI